MKNYTVKLYIFQSLTSTLFKSHFNIIIPSTLRSSEWYPSSYVPTGALFYHVLYPIPATFPTSLYLPQL